MTNLIAGQNVSRAQKVGKCQLKPGEEINKNPFFTVGFTTIIFVIILLQQPLLLQTNNRACKGTKRSDFEMKKMGTFPAN